MAYPTTHSVLGAAVRYDHRRRRMVLHYYNRWESPIVQEPNWQPAISVPHAKVLTFLRAICPADLQRIRLQLYNEGSAPYDKVQDDWGVQVPIVPAPGEDGHRLLPDPRSGHVPTAIQEEILHAPQRHAEAFRQLQVNMRRLVDSAFRIAVSMLTRQTLARSNQARRLRLKRF